MCAIGKIQKHVTGGIFRLFFLCFRLMILMCANDLKSIHVHGGMVLEYPLVTPFDQWAKIFGALDQPFGVFFDFSNSQSCEEEPD